MSTPHTSIILHARIPIPNRYPFPAKKSAKIGNGWWKLLLVGKPALGMIPHKEV
jgi:hypothetical protein